MSGATHAMKVSDLIIRDHALDRFRKHVPGAARQQATRALHDSKPVSREVVAALTQAPVRATSQDDYYIGKTDGDDWGIWVVQGEFVITYLRLGPAQVASYLLTGSGPVWHVELDGFNVTFDTDEGDAVWFGDAGYLVLSVRRFRSKVGNGYGYLLRYPWSIRLSDNRKRTVASGDTVSLDVSVESMMAAARALPAGLNKLRNGG